MMQALPNVRRLSQSFRWKIPGRTGVICQASVICQARNGVILADAGFPNLSIKRAVTCGLRTGKEFVRRRTLVERHRAIFNDEKEVNVSRSVKKFEIKIHDINNSVASSQVATGVASLSSYDVESIRTGEESCRSLRTIGSAKVKCPVAAAR